MTRPSKSYLILLAGIMIATLGLAQDSDSASATATEPSDEALSQPANADDASSTLRDPFWPVGWEPAPITPDAPKKVKPDFTPLWGKVLRSIKVTSLSETFEKGTYIAIIKGYGVVEKGDILPIRMGGYTYQILIKDITSRGIVPEKKGVHPSK